MDDDDREKCDEARPESPGVGWELRPKGLRPTGRGWSKGGPGARRRPLLIIGRVRPDSRGDFRGCPLPIDPKGLVRTGRPARSPRAVAPWSSNRPCSRLAEP